MSQGGGVGEGATPPTLTEFKITMDSLLIEASPKSTCHAPYSPPLTIYIYIRARLTYTAKPSIWFFYRWRTTT